MNRTTYRTLLNFRLDSKVTWVFVRYCMHDTVATRELYFRMGWHCWFCSLSAVSNYRY